MAAVSQEPDVTSPGALPWLPDNLRPLIDTLSDAVVAVNRSGTIVYANPSAEILLEWDPGELEGQTIESLVPRAVLDELEGGFGGFVEELAAGLAGSNLATTSLRRDGTEILTELTVTVIDDRRNGTIVLGTIRERPSDQFHRWSELTNQLLDTVVANQSTTMPPEQQLLADLGSQLGWDLVTLWTMAQSADLVCRHVWSDPHLETANPASSVRPARANDGATLPLHVLRSGETLWVPDLRQSEFFEGPAARWGIRSAMVFPIRYRGAVVGVVELLHQSAKPFDPGLEQLLGAISDPLGQLLVAVERAAEQEALLAEVEAARRTQDYLLRATRVLAGASDFRETLDSLAKIAVPIIADLCLIDLVDEHGKIERVACRHYDPAKRSLVEELRRDFPPDPDGPHPSVAAAMLGKPAWSAEMTDDFLRSTTRSARHLQVVKELGFLSYIAVPLEVRHEILGSLTLVSCGSGRRFGESDLAQAQQLAEQVASVLERAKRHERDHTVSHMLQHSLLPDSLPLVEGLELVARYLPASDFTEVGGDWYDAFTVGPRLALVIGDVEGHDMAAATVMGNLRVATKAFLYEEPSPARAIARLNDFALESGLARLSTALVALLDPRDGTLGLSSAGHPPPVLTDGSRAWSPRLVPGPPVGFGPTEYHESVIDVGGKTFAFFTDGLVEERGRSIEEGIDSVQRALLVHAENPLEDLAEAVLEVADGEGGRRDDIALLLIRCTGPGSGAGAASPH